MTATKSTQTSAGRAVVARGMLLLAGVVAALVLTGCGDDEQATEQRIQRERAEAAVIAKQEERIRQLEREARAKASAGPTTTGTQTPAPRTTPPPPPPPPPADDANGARTNDDWPGGSGYTAVLASVGSEAEARRIQSQATGRGLDAGVLYSSNYRSLRAGYWVVFSGTSQRKGPADERAARAKSLGYSQAYPRFVSG